MLAARAAPNRKVIHLQSDEEVAKFVEGFDG